jgi:hypothetical protein
MALIIPGPVVSEIRGSIAGVTFARNKGGQYGRARAIPLNPQTSRQVAVRSAVADLAQYWSNTLTAAQRTAWSLYAANVPIPNSLGQPRNVSGQNMFIRANSLILDCGGSILAAAPTNFTVGPTVSPTFTIDSAADTIDITALPGLSIASPGVYVFVSASRPQNAGVNFYKSPFQKVFGELALTGTNAPPYEDLPLPYPVAAGQALWLRAITCTADGRVGVATIQRFLVS